MQVYPAKPRQHFHKDIPEYGSLFFGEGVQNNFVMGVKIHQVGWRLIGHVKLTRKQVLAECFGSAEHQVKS